LHYEHCAHCLHESSKVTSLAACTDTRRCRIELAAEHLLLVLVLLLLLV